MFAVFVLRFSEATMTCNRQRTTEPKIMAWAYGGAERLISMRGSLLAGESSDHEIRLIASFFYGSLRF